MKKVLILLTALAMVLTSVPCYATQVFGDGEVAQSTVYCTIESSFCVVIPQTIDCMNSFRFTAEYINIRDSQQVNVYLNGGPRVPLTNDNGETVDVEFVADGRAESTLLGSFAKDMLESSIMVHCQPRFTSDTKAGDYSGTVEFVVKLENIGV